MQLFQNSQKQTVKVQLQLYTGLFESFYTFLDIKIIITKYSRIFYILAKYKNKDNYYF